MIFIFDLDGTLADYGCAVPQSIADAVNALGHVYILSGGTVEHMAEATALIEHKTLIGLADVPGNHRIDMAEILGVTKEHYIRSEHYQQVRRRMVLALREHFGKKIYSGGRSTIDLMLAKDKADAVADLGNPHEVIYFYDCMWTFNEETNNDWPVVLMVDRSVKTSMYRDRVVEDIRQCLASL